MADPQHLAKLKQGVKAWNTWREENPNIVPNLRRADLPKINLKGAFLARADLEQASLERVNLEMAILWKANLGKANLWRASLTGADFLEAKLLWRESTWRWQYCGKQI